MSRYRGVTEAVIAAFLFGMSTPFSKIMLGDIKPFMLAGLLYFGSGIGLSLYMLIRPAFGRGGAGEEASVRMADAKWLLGATLFGGFLGPLFLVYGLSNTGAATASLLLNLEGVLTALLAWFVFSENFDARIALGMVFITCGGVLLSWAGAPDLAGVVYGPLAIAAACACWAIDNNLTKKISAGDPFQIAAIKGLVAGGTNLLISFGILGLQAPPAAAIVKSCLIGFFGYGVSLAMFVLALRHIGAARTGAYFSLAPFFGAIAAISMLREPLTGSFSTAALLMAAGVWCHISESHEHEHEHGHLLHEHAHTHDDMHHEHEHEGEGAEANGAHSHAHTHRPGVHSHFHYPDLHHEHGH